MKKTLQVIAGLGMTVYAVSWFMTVTPGNGSGISATPGWGACYMAFVYPLFTLGGQELSLLTLARDAFSTTSSLTNALMLRVLAAWLFRTRLRRRWGVLLIGVFGFNSGWQLWMSSEVEGPLGPGYYFWWLSFLIVGLALVAAEPSITGHADQVDSHTSEESEPPIAGAHPTTVESEPPIAGTHPTTSRALGFGRRLVIAGLLVATFFYAWQWRGPYQPVNPVASVLLTRWGRGGKAAPLEVMWAIWSPRGEIGHARWGCGEGSLGFYDGTRYAAWDVRNNKLGPVSPPNEIATWIADSSGVGLHADIHDVVQTFDLHRWDRRYPEENFKVVFSGIAIPLPGNADIESFWMKRYWGTAEVYYELEGVRHVLLKRWLFNAHELPEYSRGMIDPCYEYLGFQDRQSDGNDWLWLFTMPQAHPPATLSGAFERHDADLDGDGLVNAISIAPEIDVRTSGNYTIAVDMISESYDHRAEVEVSRPPGRSSAKVVFASSDLRKFGFVDKPVKLRATILDRTGNVCDERILGSLFIDRDSLDGPEITWIGPKGMTRVDEDHDGRSEAFEYRFEVDLREPGQFICEGELDSDAPVPGLIGHSKGYLLNRPVTMPAGRQTFVLRFNGCYVEKSANYSIIGLRLYRIHSGDDPEIGPESTPIGRLDASAFECERSSPKNERH